MPHFLLEYTDNIADKINFTSLFSEIHSKLAETGLFSINDFKSRAVRHSTYYIGDDNNNKGFVAVTLSILSGRDDGIKKQLSDIILEILKQNFSESSSRLKFGITVQIKDIHRNSYGRFTNL